MDEKRPRERIVSILNNDDCPSFTIRRKEPSLASERRKSIERPNLLRQAHYTGRNSSFSSSGSPPLLRFDSSSSTSSKSTISMDSTPSPITPAYHYNDGLVSFNDLAAYMPSPTSITPFMDQTLIGPPMTTRYLQDMSQKYMPQLAPAQYPLVPIPPSESSSAEPSIPSLTSENSNSTLNSKSSPSANSTGTNSNPPPKKNKYPCPYATSHNCHATFTTSGHAARHGKKHTGEKGVHCPICNKAFTRKDNMKQHQRTHKNGSSSVSSNSTTTNAENSEDSSHPRRSKAAVTKEAAAQKAKSRKDSIASIDVSTPSTLVATTIPTPPSPVQTLNPGEQPTTIFPLTMLLPNTSTQSAVGTQALYPHINDPAAAAAILNSTSLNPNNPLNMPPIKPDPTQLPPGSDPAAAANILSGTLGGMADPHGLTAAGAHTIIPPIPPLVRGFSDLDTLAQAAESFDPYYM